jgi:hypothetical protein
MHKIQNYLEKKYILNFQRGVNQDEKLQVDMLDIYHDKEADRYRGEKKEVRHRILIPVEGINCIFNII